MTPKNLGSKAQYGNGKDDIVIRKYGAGIKGGRILDVDGFAPDTIRAGHVVIRGKDTDGNDVFKPLNVSEGNYVSLPQNYEYAGVVVASVPTAEPLVSIMYDGEVNDIASPYPITTALKTALRTALPKLAFQHD